MMNFSKRLLISLLLYSFLVFGLTKAKAQMTTVFSDDYDDVWDATPVPGGLLGDYIGVPNVSGGIARGIGSGYSPPLHTWMVEPLAFTSETLEVTLRGESGPSWPNVAGVWLMDASWGGHGQQQIGYEFRIYGESSNSRFVIVKDPWGGEQLANFNIGSTITDWHTYVVSRDAAGNWSLSMDGVTQSPSFMNPDLSYTDFTYIGSHLYRDQSALDYVEVKAIPDPCAIVLVADVDINPDILNLNSKGKWITCYIELPEGYSVSDIDVESVLLEDLLEVQHSDIQGSVLMVKFDRQDLIAYLEFGLGVTPPENVTLTVSGDLTDGPSFEGTDIIRVIDEGN